MGVPVTIRRMRSPNADAAERATPPEIDPQDAVADYQAEQVLVTVGPRQLLDDGIAFVVDGWLIVAANGEQSIFERIIAAAPAAGVSVVGKPKIGLGAAIRLRFPADAHVLDDVPKRDGEWVIDLLPEAGYRTGIATPGKIKRARASVRDLESVLAGAGEA